jgi:hypothetical protein
MLRVGGSECKSGWHGHDGRKDVDGTGPCVLLVCGDGVGRKEMIRKALQVPLPLPSPVTLLPL